MAKTEIRNPRVKQVFEDLEKFRDFCRNYGYIFNERDLYSQRSYVWRQYQKLLAGKPVKDQWEFDLTSKRRT